MIDNGRKNIVEDADRYGGETLTAESARSGLSDYKRQSYVGEKRVTKNTTEGFERIIDGASGDTATKAKADITPSSTTMQFEGKDRKFIYEDYETSDGEDIPDDEETSYKINTKGKIMIAVYALVVLTIFTLIILNTRLLKTMNDNISRQEARVEELRTVNAELNEKYEFVSSDDEISRKAQEFGMVKN